MDFQRFMTSLGDAEPPAGLSPAMQALWWDAKGDWVQAHRCAQAQEDQTGAWVHAYLHRKEGDLPNAAYWYQQAGRTPAQNELDEEWRDIARAIVRQERPDASG